MPTAAIMSGLRLTEGSRGLAASVAVEGAPLTRTQVPYVTGSSVLGMKCADGVVIACDTMGTLGRRGAAGALRRDGAEGANRGGLVAPQRGQLLGGLAGCRIVSALCGACSLSG